MTKTISRAFTGVALVIVGLVLAAACNGDADGGTMTLEEYFTALQAIEAAAESGGDELAGPYALPDDATADDLRASIADYREETAAHFGEYLEALDALDPPDDVAELHAEYREALDSYSSAFDDFFGRAEEAGALPEVDYETDSEFIEALTRANQACTNFEEFAATNDITVSLRCIDN